MIDDINTILRFFYQNQGVHSLTRDHFIGIDRMPIIEGLITDGLLYSKNISNGRMVYGISLNGKLLFQRYPKLLKTIRKAIIF